MDDIQTIQASKRGGKRVGAGRRGIVRSMLLDPRFAEARGISPLYASEILARVVDERRAWQRIFKSGDDRVVLDALKFLVAMRDGKPAQQINVTSRSITMNVSDLERARAIVREIRGEMPAIPIIGTGGQLGSSATTTDANGASIMLSGDEGGKKDG